MGIMVYSYLKTLNYMGIMVYSYLKTLNYGNYGIFLVYGYCRIYIISRRASISVSSLQRLDAHLTDK